MDFYFAFISYNFACFLLIIPMSLIRNVFFYLVNFIYSSLDIVRFIFLGFNRFLRSVVSEVNDCFMILITFFIRTKQMDMANCCNRSYYTRNLHFPSVL